MLHGGKKATTKNNSLQYGHHILYGYKDFIVVPKVMDKAYLKFYRNTFPLEFLKRCILEVIVYWIVMKNKSSELTRLD